MIMICSKFRIRYLIKLSDNPEGFISFSQMCSIFLSSIYSLDRNENMHEIINK